MNVTYIIWPSRLNKLSRVLFNSHSNNYLPIRANPFVTQLARYLIYISYTYNKEIRSISRLIALDLTFE